MNIINFSHNWNGKLNNKYFTTIRSAIGNKFEYYSDKVGEIFAVRLNGKEVAKARLVFVEKRWISDICEALLIVDTGTENYMDVFKKFGIDGTDDVIILTFKKEAVADE